ncbi:MAG TPA: hypothetical protein VMA72_26420 [Streptosporangiaceae bacterium]|nr:hypothetical protein [Streptosporangiaceae bacterium]
MSSFSLVPFREFCRPIGFVWASSALNRAVVARLGDDYAVSVFPFIEGASHSVTDWAAYTSAGAVAGFNPSAVDLYWHIGLLWGSRVSTGTLHSPHVDDPDTQDMWTVLQSLLSEADEASSRRRR